jgi:L-lactate dehydrogenase complex protein LldG
MAETSRDTILQSLRATNLEPVELPDLDQPWGQFADPRAQFAEVLEAVGGRCLCAADLQEVNHQLGQLPAFQEARLIGSSVAGIDRVNTDVNSVADPHELEKLDFFIAAGEFAVAENGAVWVPGSQVSHRVLFFIVQHLVLIVPADRVLHNLHEAYELLRFDRPEFGLFISGPSKTADIEQSLVIGAHGARSLIVFLLESPVSQ